MPREHVQHIPETAIPRSLVNNFQPREQAIFHQQPPSFSSSNDHSSEERLVIIPPLNLSTPLSQCQQEVLSVVASLGGTASKTQIHIALSARGITLNPENIGEYIQRINKKAGHQLRITNLSPRRGMEAVYALSFEEKPTPPQPRPPRDSYHGRLIAAIRLAQEEGTTLSFTDGLRAAIPDEEVSARRLKGLIRETNRFLKKTHEKLSWGPSSETNAGFFTFQPVDTAQRRSNGKNKTSVTPRPSGEKKQACRKEIKRVTLKEQRDKQTRKEPKGKTVFRRKSNTDHLPLQLVPLRVPHTWNDHSSDKPYREVIGRDEPIPPEWANKYRLVSREEVLREDDRGKTKRVEELTIILRP